MPLKVKVNPSGVGKAKGKEKCGNFPPISVALKAQSFPIEALPRQINHGPFATPDQHAFGK